MSVDLFERRFRQELEKLPRFERKGAYDSRVWEAHFPVSRALFSGLCLYCHSTGYRLPSFNDYFSLCEKAYTKSHPESERFKRFFEEELRQGMRQRVSVWYEACMAETYLYACLVEAIEDKAKCGVVLYDSRADWKLKVDVFVIVKNQPIRISAYFGAPSDRPKEEKRRNEIELMQKKNTMESSHWGNVELSTMPLLEIPRTDDFQEVNGIRLFSLRAVNRLLEDIYLRAGVEQGRFFF